MKTFPIRLTPGQYCRAAFVLSGTVAFDGAQSSSHLEPFRLIAADLTEDSAALWPACQVTTQPLHGS